MWNAPGKPGLAHVDHTTFLGCIDLASGAVGAGDGVPDLV